MKITIHNAAERGTADYGWLQASYYFSFGNYHNPSRVHFGALRVLNDDKLAGGGGFPMHPHENMEIVTIPLSGSLAHNDNTGGAGVISTGDVQIMSAGTGVEHAEKNASSTDPVHLFQIWVFPKKKNIPPRYDQKTFNIHKRINKWQTVVSPIEEHKALWINQDAVFSLSNLEAGKFIEYKISFPGNAVYLVVISGKAKINSALLHARDAAGITDTESFSIYAEEDTSLLAVEVPYVISS